MKRVNRYVDADKLIERLNEIYKGSMTELCMTPLGVENFINDTAIYNSESCLSYPPTAEQKEKWEKEINTLHEKTSIIVTTNKSPTEWAERLEDEVLATAILDRLMYKCEVVKLSGESYIMTNRQTIFKD